MRDNTAEQVNAIHDRMKNRRCNWESHWQEIAERVLPSHAVFNRKYLYGGEKRTQRIFDATSAFALTRFAAIMESLLTPHTQVWHRLKSPFEEVNANPDVQRYFYDANRVLFGMRYSSAAGFIAASQEYYLSVGGFGTGAIFLQEVNTNYGVEYRYISVPLSELFIETDFSGRAKRVVREWERTADQIVREFDGRKGSTIGDDLRRAASKEPERKYTVLHYVGPADEHGGGGRQGFGYVSYYVLKDTGSTLSKGGYYSMPYIIGRYMTAPAEDYGRSPAMIVLPDIKMLNEMSRTNIRAAHRAAEPPLLTMEDGSLTRISMQPNALIGGGLDDQGRQRVVPMQTGGDVGLSLEMMNQRRQMINDAFFITLFQILVETPRMTATEVIERAQEKSSLLSPIMGRQQHELLGPLIDRELDIAERSGALPEMPAELRDAGGQFVIEYESPLTRMQQAEEVSGIMRTLETVLPVMQIDPSVADNFDWDETTRILSRANGASPKIMRKVEEVIAMREARAQAEQQQQQAMMAEPVSAAVKNTAQARKFEAEAAAL
jgi:hypothetical protein